MAVTADKGEDKGKESRTTEQLRAANAASWHPDNICGSGQGSTQQLRPNRAPCRGPATRSQPGSSLRESAVTARGRGDVGQ